MNGLSPQDKKLPGLPDLEGVIAEEQISSVFGLTAGGSLNLRVDVVASGVTVVGELGLKLQHKAPGDSSPWQDIIGTSTSITGNGVFSMTQNVQVAAHQQNMPLRKTVRAVLTLNNAGDRVTIDNVWVSQAL